jgi:hypothetical protein
MPAAVNTQIRAQVIKEWLSGNTRDEIAANNKIGAGTVSNIIGDWKKGLDRKEYDSIRELSVFLNREGITSDDQASLVRLNNYIKKLGANFGQIESFITNIANSPEPEKLIETVNQIGSLSIPLDKIEDHIKGQKEEKEKLKKEVERDFKTNEHQYSNCKGIQEIGRGVVQEWFIYR